MAKNLYILAGTLGGLAVLAIVLSLTGVAAGPASPGDAALWRMTGIAFLVIAIATALGGVLTALFEQAERKDAEQRARKRRR